MCVRVCVCECVCVWNYFLLKLSSMLVVVTHSEPSPHHIRREETHLHQMVTLAMTVWLSKVVTL